MFIRISLLLLALPLHSSQHFPVCRAAVDDQIRIVENKVLKAKIALLQAHLDKAPEEIIKKCEDEVSCTATKMLHVLTMVEERDLEFGDVDFCLSHKPDIHAKDEGDIPPLFRAVQHNITLVRELIRAGVDVNHVAQTVLGDTNALGLIRGTNRSNTPILLEAGATLMCDSDGNPCWWLWDEDVKVHRQKLIDTIDETYLLPTVLSPIVVNYAFGEPPKIDRVTEDLVKNPS